MVFNKNWINFLFIILLMSNTYAWTIGGKGRITGPSIHSTYFITPNNAPFPIHAKLLVGNLLNGICAYNTAYDLGNEELRTGDVVDFDAYALKALIGNGANCMAIYYNQKQQVIDSMLIVTDGINYVNTIPATSQVAVY